MSRAKSIANFGCLLPVALESKRTSMFGSPWSIHFDCPRNFSSPNSSAGVENRQWAVWDIGAAKGNLLVSNKWFDARA